MTTLEIIRTAYAEDPTLTLQAVGDMAGVTRERVRQLVKREGITIDRASRPRSCIRCRTKLQFTDMDEGRCPKCVGEINEYKYQTRPRWVSCDWCGSVRQRTVTTWRRSMGITPNKGGPAPKGRFFCNRTCFGKWMGCFKGFVAHPENTLYQRNKTHCKHGHEFTPENTYVWAGNGSRSCRQCQSRRSKEAYARKRALA